MAISGPRLLAISLGVGLLVAAVFLFWLHAPFVVSILGAAAFGAVFMLVAASLGNDPAAADAAWREAAPDLVGTAQSIEPPNIPPTDPATRRTTTAGASGRDGDER